MNSNSSLNDLHAAIRLAEQAIAHFDAQYAEADRLAHYYLNESNRLHESSQEARRILRESRLALRETEAYLARPIDGTDEASALATVEAILNGQVA